MALKASGKPSKSPTVRITCLVFGKQHRTRFYTTKPSDKERSDNMTPGLVANSIITHPYFFFLQSYATVKALHEAHTIFHFVMASSCMLNSCRILRIHSATPMALPRKAPRTVPRLTMLTSYGRGPLLYSRLAAWTPSLSTIIKLYNKRKSDYSRARAPRGEASYGVQTIQHLGYGSKWKVQGWEDTLASGP